MYLKSRQLCMCARSGPGYLLEMVNATGSIWTKAGTLVKAWDLNVFFGVPTGYTLSDPRVLYDAASGRWFASGVAFDTAFDSQTFAAISQSSDPTLSWFVYQLASNLSGTVYDQPKLGVSADKVVVSWNDFSSAGTLFTGQETRVLQKSDMQASVSLRWTGFGPDRNRAGLVPVQSLTSVRSAYLVYNGNLLRGSPYAGAYLGLVAVTGVPAHGTVTASR